MRELWPLLLLIGAATLVYSLYAVQVRFFQPDETLHLELARYIEHAFPGALFELDVYQRGLQRLYIFLIAIPFAIFPAADSFSAARVVNGIAFASTVIPTFLLCRGLGLTRGQAYLTSSLVLLVPWAGITSGLLTENLAYPMAVWAIFGVWRTAVAPSVGADLLALALLLLAALTRLSLAFFLGVLIVAVILQELRYGVDERSWAKRMIGLPRALWAHHPLLCALGVASVLALLLDAVGAFPGGLKQLTGTYPSTFSYLSGDIPGRFSESIAIVIAGVGFVPMLLGGPWLVRELLMPREPRYHAFAAAALAATFFVLLATLAAGEDERYLIYIAPLAFVAMGAALFRVGLGPVAVGIGGACVVALLSAASWYPDHELYGFLTWPAETFYAREILGSDGAGAKVLAGALVLLVAAACAVAVSARRAAVGFAAAIVVALFGYQLWQTLYSLDHFVHGDEGRKIPGAETGVELEQATWVEKQVRDGEIAAIYADSSGNTPRYFEAWRELRYYNPSLREFVWFEIATAPIALGYYGGVHLTPQGKTGRLRSSKPMPALVAVPRDFVAYGLDGKLEAIASHLPLTLLRPARPPRLRWSVSGTNKEGLIRAGQTATVRAYSNGLGAPGAQCLTVDVVAPPGFQGTRAFRLTSQGGGRSRVLRTEQASREVVPLPGVGRGGRPFADAHITVTDAGPPTRGVPKGLFIGTVLTGACGDRDPL